MNPITMPHNNLILKAPLDWDENMHGVCEDLHITNCEGILYSYWKPTWKERIQILFGNHIRLSMVSQSHPPVAIDCES